VQDNDSANGRGQKRVRVGLISLGCAKNLVDTEVMIGHLETAGATLVSDPAQADVLVVNTCGFIGPAREESIAAILEAAEYKNTGRARRLVVAGCMVQRYADELRADLPEVDAFIGLDELPRIVEASGLRPPTAAVAGTHQPSRYLYDHTTPRHRTTPPWTAYVKIAEGCDHACSFCAIPVFRGRFRSRPVEDIAAEARMLA